MGVLINPSRFAAAGGGSAYQTLVLASSPLGYWRMGDPSGTTMTDTSGNARNGTYNGSPILATTGLVSGDADTCVDFTPNQFGQIARAAWMDAATITVEAIINPDVVNTEQHIVTRDDLGAGPGRRCFQFGIASNGKLFAILFVRGTGAAVVFTSGTTALSTGTRYHIALVTDGATMKIYRNGVQDQSGTFVASIDTSTLEPINIARTGHASTFRSFNGRIDEVAYYGTALSAATIAAHATAAGV